MALIAMAGPMSFAAKLFAAYVMLGLVALLLRTIRGWPFTGTSVATALVGTLVLVLATETHLPSASFLAGFRDLGVLAAVSGALCGVLLLRPERTRKRVERSHGALRLPAIALVTGLASGLVLGALAALSPNTVPGEQMSLFLRSVVIGAVAGVIGAAILAAVSITASFEGSASESSQDTQE